MSDLPMFPKPGQVKKRQEAIRVMRDGREICNMNCAEGRRIYADRVRQMWERQGRKCGLQISPQCKAKKGYLHIKEAQFDHEIPRGGGRRDDRIQINGKNVSHAVCGFCNCLRGSRKLTDFDEIPL